MSWVPSFCRGQAAHVTRQSLAVPRVSPSFNAGDGGDTPEHVSKALFEALERSSWSASKNTLRIVYLVGDAPPHEDYKDVPSWPAVAQRAAEYAANPHIPLFLWLRLPEGASSLALMPLAAEEGVEFAPGSRFFGNAVSLGGSRVSDREIVVQGAGEHLASAGVLFLYGPYKRGGAHTAPSNEAFDNQLRATNPAWGIRNMEDVAELGRAADLWMEEAVPMPANNFCLIFRRTGI